MNSEVKVYHLSEKELEQKRIGAKCDLEDRQDAQRIYRWGKHSAGNCERAFGGWSWKKGKSK